MLVNRLVLNLRKAGQNDSNDTVSSLAMLSFAESRADSFLGNIGAPLQDGYEDREEEQDAHEMTLDPSHRAV